MSDPFDSAASGATQGFLRWAAEEYRAFWHRRRQKAALKRMLRDPRFGFRSTARLAKAIGADEQETSKLLLAIRARASETSDEWTLKDPPTSRRRR
jgi:hypothetical protein